MPLFIKKLDPRATVPTCAHPGEDLAFDLYALEDTVITGNPVKVRTGVAINYNPGLYKYGLLIRDRSSMAARGMYVIGGVIDAGYTGEVIVLFMHQLYAEYTVKAGDKIAQVIPIPVLTHEGVVEVNELSGSRGDKGFGSSGK